MQQLQSHQSLLNPEKLFSYIRLRLLQTYFHPHLREEQHGIRPNDPVSTLFLLQTFGEKRVGGYMPADQL